MPDNDNEKSKGTSRTLPIIKKMDEMMPLIDAIDNFDSDYDEPWEMSPTIKFLDKIVNEIRLYIKDEIKRDLSFKPTRRLLKWIYHQNILCRRMISVGERIAHMMEILHI